MQVIASQHIDAPPERVAALYADPANWGAVFPATIRGARLVRRDGDALVIHVDHVEGPVANVLTRLSRTRFELKEWKRRYEATFVNAFEPEDGGTRYTLTGRIRLRWPYLPLAPLVRPLVRARMRRYVLAPLKAAAERRAAPGPASPSRSST